jgi:membrane fusion protein, multidrug efflux system
MQQPETPEKTAPENPAAEKVPKRKKVIRLAIFTAATLLIAGSAISYRIRSAGYETTDNAQLDGDIESVRSSITSYIDTIRFADNQPVKKGDTLIRFNTDVLLAKVQQAEAALNNAGVDVLSNDNKVSASVENANASLQTSQYSRQEIVTAKANLDKAQQDFDRTSDLLSIKAATREQYETMGTKLQVAQATYSQAIGKQQSLISTARGLKATARSAENQTSAAKALVKQRQAGLRLALLELNHAYVLAPFDGIVTRRAVQQGQYVSAGQTLCAVVDTAHLWISANFKETQLYKIRPGQEVSITIDACPGLSGKGHVESFGGATGAKFSLLPPDNSTGNFIKITQRFPIRIAIDTFFAPQNKPTVLYSGLSAFIKVNTQ